MRQSAAQGIEARERPDREDGLDPKGESPAPKGIAMTTLKTETDMPSDLVTRLTRKVCEHWPSEHCTKGCLVNPDGPEAAAEITRLNAVIAAKDSGLAWIEGQAHRIMASIADAEGDAPEMVSSLASDIAINAALSREPTTAPEPKD